MEIKKTGTEQKLWIFGDSFTGQYHKEKSWQAILYKKFIGNHIHISSKGSRDSQTVIDTFLKNIWQIKSDDFVIIFLPTISRWRLPLENPQPDVEWSDTLFNHPDKFKYLDYFIGGNGAYGEGNTELEEPLKFFDYDCFRPGKNAADFQHTYTQNINKKKLDHSKLTIGDINTLIHGSEAFIKNMNEILESFKKYFPFNIYLVSWTDEYDKILVDGKSELIEKIGFWHTLSNVFDETNGLEGRRGDAHWSEKMDKGFANYLIVKFPKFFNT